jgi:molybdenum cofactor cytidylyltransferase
LRALLARNYVNPKIVHNPRWQDGIASSLHAGISALPENARGALILLTDQPGVSSRSLQRLVDTWLRQPSRAVAAGYGDSLGVPAILPRRLFRDLTGIQGDAGAKTVLRKTDSRTVLVDMPEALFDIDTTEDRLRLAHRST